MGRESGSPKGALSACWPIVTLTGTLVFNYANTFARTVHLIFHNRKCRQMLRMWWFGVTVIASLVTPTKLINIEPG